MLSAEDVEGLRTVLESGKRPRVMFAPSAGQMAGQLGHVTRLTDPSDDPEFVVVRFGKDELGFAPTDLLVVPKRKPAPRRPTVTAADLTPALAGPPLLPPSPKPAKGHSGTAMEKIVEKTVEKTPAPRKTARPKPTAELTVTLTCHSGHWSVQAARGTKVVAKPLPVRAPDALAMVALLDVPAVRDVVDELVTAARAAAEAEAMRLRSALAEVEARLAELPA